MGKKKEEYINYDIFMAEMIPKTKKRVFISKKTQPSFRIWYCWIQTVWAISNYINEV